MSENIEEKMLLKLKDKLIEKGINADLVREKEKMFIDITFLMKKNEKVFYHTSSLIKIQVKNIKEKKIKFYEVHINERLDNGMFIEQKEEKVIEIILSLIELYNTMMKNKIELYKKYDYCQGEESLLIIY